MTDGDADHADEMKPTLGLDVPLDDAGPLDPLVLGRQRRNASAETLLATVHEFADDRHGLAERVRPRGVTDPPLVKDPDIDLQQVARLEFLGVVPARAMDDALVDRQAGVGRERDVAAVGGIAEEARRAREVLEGGSHKLIDLRQGHPVPEKRSDTPVRLHHALGGLEGGVDILGLGQSAHPPTLGGRNDRAPPRACIPAQTAILPHADCVSRFR